jgi:hypothetical protein
LFFEALSFSMPGAIFRLPFSIGFADQADRKQGNADALCAKIQASDRSSFASSTCVWKEQRMKKVVSVVILCLSTLCLSACAILNVGPCYGVGCPAFASTKSVPAQQTTTQNTGDAKTLNQVETKNTSVPEAQSKRGQ